MASLIKINNKIKINNQDQHQHQDLDQADVHLQPQCNPHGSLTSIYIEQVT